MCYFFLKGQGKGGLTRPNSHVLVSAFSWLQKDGEQKPGSKGLALSQDQWQKLLAGLPSLSNALGTQEVGFSVDLGSNRLASVSSFKGSLGVDFREHYEKDGNLAPGMTHTKTHWTEN